MKKLLFLLALIASISCVNAQVVNLKSQYGNNVDTVTNTGTKYLTSGVISTTVKNIAVQVDLTEISGTTGGTLTLQYSLDGVTYFSLAADSTYTPADVASQTFGWFIKLPAPFKYLRVKYTGTGTMSDKISAKLWAY